MKFLKDPSAIAESFCNYLVNITAEFNIKKPSTNTRFPKLKESIESKRGSNNQVHIPMVTAEFVKNQLLQLSTLVQPLGLTI